jgi:hypothetical protein
MATMVIVVTIASLITSLLYMCFNLQLLSLLNLTYFWLTKETPVGPAINLMVRVIVYLIGVGIFIYAYICAYNYVYICLYIGMVSLVRPLIGCPLVTLSSAIGL